MEPPNESSGLSSYYHHHQHHQPHQHHHLHPPPPPSPPHHQAPSAPPTNGILSNPTETSAPHPGVYPHSVPSAVSSPLETVRRKRGRPRKYGTPEQAAASKRLSSSSIHAPRKVQSLRGVAASAPSSSFASASSRKSPSSSLGSVVQSFTPHIISVAAGEDVGQKIMSFMQQNKCEICILSASGSISNASLRQPATSGGSIAYEGQFNILSLSGSYVRTSFGGRTGGLSVCLSSTDGVIIGGGVGGPLTAAGPVQVIVGTFVMDEKKNRNIDLKGDTLGSKLASPIGGASFSNVEYHVIDHQDVGSHLLQPTWHTGNLD